LFEFRQKTGIIGRAIKPKGREYMAIRVKHEAAGIPASGGAGSPQRKYGQDLVMQQRKYDLDTKQRMQDNQFDMAKTWQNNAFQAQRDQQAAVNDASRFNAGLAHREKLFGEERKFQMEDMENARQRAMMDEARKMETGFLMDAIENGEFDDITAREIQQSLMKEAEALANKGLDAAQRAEVLNQIKAERLRLTQKRRPKPPPPTAGDRFNQARHVDDQGREWMEDPKGGWTMVPPKEQELPPPTSGREALARDEKLREKWVNRAKEGMVMEPGVAPDYEKINDRAEQLWEADQKRYGAQPAAPQGPTGQAGPMNPSTAPAPMPSSPPPPAGTPMNPATAPMPGAPVIQQPTFDMAPPVPGATETLPAPGTQPPMSPATSPAPGTMVNEPYMVGQGATGGAVKDPYIPTQPDAAWEKITGLPKKTPEGTAKSEPVAAPSNATTQSPAQAANSEFWDKRMSEAKNDGQKASVKALQDFVSKGQPPEVENAIMKASNSTLPKADRMAAIAFLLAKGVDISQIVNTKHLK